MNTKQTFIVHGLQWTDRTLELPNTTVVSVDVNGPEEAALQQALRDANECAWLGRCEHDDDDPTECACTTKTLALLKLANLACDKKIHQNVEEKFGSSLQAYGNPTVVPSKYDAVVLWVSNATE